jgi:hypothetical protein
MKKAFYHSLLWSASGFVLLAGCQQSRSSTKSAVPPPAATRTTAATCSAPSPQPKSESDANNPTSSSNCRELKKHLPASIAGYAADGRAEGQAMQLTGMHYATVKQHYKKGHETMSVQLLDYREAAAMFSAASAMMNVGMEMENDEQLMRGVNVGIPGVKAYETLGKKDHKASLVLGVSDHFFIAIEASGQHDTELVRAAAHNLDFASLTKM